MHKSYNRQDITDRVGAIYYWAGFNVEIIVGHVGPNVSAACL